ILHVKNRAFMVFNGYKTVGPGTRNRPAASPNGLAKIAQKPAVDFFLPVTRDPRLTLIVDDPSPLDCAARPVQQALVGNPHVAWPAQGAGLETQSALKRDSPLRVRRH